MSKIVRFEAENYKRIKAVEITPEGHVIELRGKNAQGKTSILDAIESALSYAGAKKSTSRPIRDGEDKARVFLDLGDIKVTRIYKPGGKSDLVVESAEGARFSSPQAILDKLYGRLSFDPLAFANAAEKDQKATLLSVVDLPFDLDELAGQRAAAYDQRREVNREITSLDGQIAGLPEPGPSLPAVEQSASELLAEYQGKQEVQGRRQSAVRAIAQGEADVVRLEAELAQCRERMAGAQAFLDRTPAEDLAPYEARLANIDSINAAVRDAHRRREVVAERDKLQAESDGFTAQIEALDAQKSEALAAAVMPLDGLSFDDDGVTYQGVPFSQASGAEKLRVSLAMAMALNPELRVIRITDGSLLDSDNLALIHEMAEKHDFQVWIEVVSTDGSVGVLISDGQVA